MKKYIVYIILLFCFSLFAEISKIGYLSDINGKLIILRGQELIKVSQGKKYDIFSKDIIKSVNGEAVLTSLYGNQIKIEKDKSIIADDLIKNYKLDDKIEEKFERLMTKLNIFKKHESKHKFQLTASSSKGKAAGVKMSNIHLKKLTVLYKWDESEPNY